MESAAGSGPLGSKTQAALVSVLVNASLYDYCPEVVAAFRARGDEVVAHGRTNSERQGVLGEAEEAEEQHHIDVEHARGDCVGAHDAQHENDRHQALARHQ